MFDYYRAWNERNHNLDIEYSEGRIHLDEFQDSGFRLEQVTNGVGKPVQWGGVALPQVKLRGTVDEFLHSPEWIRDLSIKMGSSNARQRNFSKHEWHMYELYVISGARTGYFRLRRWLRALRDGMRW